MAPPPAITAQVSPPRWFYRGSRPDEGWHAHGVTCRRLTLLHGGRLRSVLLVKQRWLDPTTGRTVHSRPGWEVAWSAYGLGVVMTVLGTWLMAGEGLHQLGWPWASDRPSRRSVQRWMPRVRRDATAWLDAIRRATIDLISPRPLEEIIPVEGIPPPGRKARRQKSDSLPDHHLREGIWLLKRVAQQESTPIRTLLAEAKARWQGSKPTIDTIPSA